MMKWSKLLLGISILLMPLAPLESEAWVATRMRKAKSAATPRNFFVLTNAGFAGDFGGLAAANALCLTDLTNNDWVGKADAVLNSSTVKAFLCDAGSCQNLQPSRTYYFAVSNYPYGGASFTTNATGAGPGDNATWFDANRFGNEANWGYWTNRSAGADPARWPASQATDHCSNWSTATAGVKGTVGAINYTNASRWNDGTVRGCNNAYSLICMVDAP